MPKYDFVCQSGHKWEDIVPVDRKSRCPTCKRIGKKLFSGQVMTLIPWHMTAEYDRVNSGRQKAWIEKPETQAKLKSGEYSVMSKSDDANQ